jgi:hypothetical protein
MMNYLGLFQYIDFHERTLFFALVYVCLMFWRAYVLNSMVPHPLFMPKVLLVEEPYFGVYGLLGGPVV